MYNLTIKEMAEIEGWSLTDSEEEKLELEEYWEKKGDPIEKKCDKCGDWMVSTRVKPFQVPAYTHTSGGDRRERKRRANVCYYCLKDGWRPIEIRTNHNKVYWKNVFEKTNPYVKKILNNMKSELLEKVKKFSKESDQNLMKYGMTPYDIGVKKVFEYYAETYEEFHDSLYDILTGDKSKLDNVLNSSTDLMNALMLINWTIREMKERESKKAMPLTLEAMNKAWDDKHDEW